MANTWSNTQLVAKGLDTMFRYTGAFTSTITNVNKLVGKEDQEMVKNGQSFDVKLKTRMRNTGTEGTIDRSFDAQPFYYDTRAFALEDWSKAHQEITLDLQATNLDSVRDDIIIPSKNAIVTSKEKYHQKAILEIGNTVLSDSDGADIDDASSVRDRLDELGMEDGIEPIFLLPSGIMSNIVNNTNNFFDAPSEARKMGWYKGKFKEAKDMVWAKSNLLPIHTNGTATDGAFANGVTPLGLIKTDVAQNAVTVVLDDIGTDGTITKGSVIEFASSEAVNTVTYDTLGYRAQFAVAETQTSAAGEVTLTLYEKLNDGTTADSATIQNVSALPVDGDVHGWIL